MAPSASASSTTRVAVTGLGAVCSLGLGVPALWDGLLRGQPTAQRRSALSSLGLGELPICLTPLSVEGEALEDGQALLGQTARARLLSDAAAGEAMASAGWSAGVPTGTRLGLALGCTNGEKALWLHRLRELVAAGQDAAAAGGPLAYGPAAPARALGSHYRAAELRVISSACASGNAAIGTALGWIRHGRCDVVLCGGVDALQPFVLSGFVSLRAHAKEPARPFDAARSGLNLGDGAAFLVLESAAHARRRQQPIRAFLDGSGLASDAHHMTGPDRAGRGAARAIALALHDAGLLPEAIDFVSAHGTATVFNDLMEAQALAAVFGRRAATLPINSIKGAIGHCLGAAGALEAVMAVRALEEQCVPPTVGHHDLDPAIALHVVSGAPQPMALSRILSTSSGFGGINASLVFSRAATSDGEGGQR